ncbi:Nitroreductase family protein [Sandaracinus amylolyticus]|uniref:Putative NAD(P)H nitroreductase n=2 Tax=Sandaracinus amylolyticus TaxID=927083 RepID=A0A0F6W5P8_9BACT|nr:Nitroreductase family protein [Sandaracinus amylolyticus]
MMDAMELLLSRRSLGKLGEPAPEGAALDRILRVALRAPDHGALRPWRVLLIRGEARARFGEVMADSLKRRKPSVSDEDLARERDKALRAPLLVIVAASYKTGGKNIPEVEQLLSAGCVAYGLEIAAQAEGFGAIWKTGDAVYDRAVHERLGLGESEHIVGVLYVGTPTMVPPDGARPSVESIVSEWRG